MSAKRESPSGADVDEGALAVRIRNAGINGEAVQTPLKTDGRVLARVTDGIYRLPGAALRELISNAYDADATRVVISTDRPRFSRITVEDNGRGMTPEALAHMLHHIGGSAKRISDGFSLGITGDDPTRSPGGRRLIGKIGIGLFSVAQLTRSFQIVTKVAGDDHRTVAQIVLKQFSDEAGAEGDEQVESGLVSIWREPASQDLETHGTTIILSKIRPRAQQALRDAGLWSRVREKNASAPRYHIGAYDTEGGILQLPTGQLHALPWTSEDSPQSAFTKLVDSVWEEVEHGRGNPKLDTLFDYYLQMIWQLGLSVPLPYVAGGPFDHEQDKRQVIDLGPERGKVRQLKKEEIAQAQSNYHFGIDVGNEFVVCVDEIELQRPIRFKNFPSTSNAIKYPLLYIGGLSEDFPGIPREVSGGPLEFHAYLLWMPKVAPVDHVGALVRVHGASGTGFDPTFLKYQVAEITRLKQITCEIFVTRGLESALNIDRESLNESHPHAIRLTAWLHDALRKAINHQKALGNRLRAESREQAADAEVETIKAIVRSTWLDLNDSEEGIPAVKFVSNLRSVPDADLVFDREYVMGELAGSRSTAARSLERKLVAIQQILEAYGFLDALSSHERQALLARLSAVLRADGEL